MRSLILFRHAKSAWPPKVKDHDRPLAPRGLKTAPLMAGELARAWPRPDLVLVSSARRTEETHALMTAALAGVPFRSEPRIYEAPVGCLIDVVRETGPGVSVLMLIGHNPGLSDLALTLCNPETSDPEALRHAARGFPTAAAAELTTAAPWSAAGRAGFRLKRFLSPRLLGEPDLD